VTESSIPTAAAEDRDFLEGVDALQADLARHQRLTGAEVTATANQAFAIATIERLERQEPAAPAVAVPPPPERDGYRREVNGKVWTLDKAPAERPYRNATEFEANVMRHAMPRIELLRTKKDSGPLGSPSWSTRLDAALYFKVKQLEARVSFRFDLADEYEQRFMLDLYELLEASNASFGDWRKDAPTKLIVAG
jgi:hypothetical protein